MKRTTLALDERLMEQVKAKAFDEGLTFQDCANRLLRLGLDASRAPRAAPDPWPTFELGVPSVDLADRDAIFGLLDQS